MSKHARAFSKPLSATDPVNENGGHSETVYLEDLLHLSMEAYDLAVLSEKNFSLRDLRKSGSLEKYIRLASSLGDGHPSGNPFTAFLEKDADESWSSANCRQSYRSALVRLAAHVIFKFSPQFWRQMTERQKQEWRKRELIAAPRSGAEEGTCKGRKRTKRLLSSSDVAKLKSAAEFIIQVPPDPDHKMIRERSVKVTPQKAHPRSRESKKSALYALNDHQRRMARTAPDYNWRHHFWNTSVMLDKHLDDYRRACIAALMLTGCRPSEFCDDLGVMVTAIEHSGRPHLAFKIAGAKCAADSKATLGKGQEWRCIEIACQTPEAVWLFDYVAHEADGRITLMLDAPIQDKKGARLSPTERRRRVSGRLGKLFRRLGKIAFPKQRHALTPYVFRHALSSDLRASKSQFGEEKIAAALGHRSQRTQGHYGSPNTSRGLRGSRATQISHISACDPVRTPDRGPPASRRIGKRPEFSS